MPVQEIPRIIALLVREKDRNLSASSPQRVRHLLATAKPGRVPVRDNQYRTARQHLNQAMELRGARTPGPGGGVGPSVCEGINAGLRLHHDDNLACCDCHTDLPLLIQRQFGQGRATQAWEPNPMGVASFPGQVLGSSAWMPIPQELEVAIVVHGHQRHLSAMSSSPTASSPQCGELQGKAKDGDMLGWAKRAKRARREQVTIAKAKCAEDLLKRAARVAMQQHLATVSRRHRQARCSILMCGALAVELVSLGATAQYIKQLDHPHVGGRGGRTCRRYFFLFFHPLFPFWV